MRQIKGGGANRKRTLPENLETSSKALAHQPKRITCCLPNNLSTKEPVEGKSSAAPVGQQNGNIIYSKPGGHEICSPVRPNEPTANAYEPIGDVTDCTLHPQQLQLNCKQPVPPEKTFPTGICLKWRRGKFSKFGALHKWTYLLQSYQRWYQFTYPGTAKTQRRCT